VLRVHGVVHDGGIEPQPVTLAAVVERRLVIVAAGAMPAAAAAAASPTPALRPIFLGLVRSGFVGLVLHLVLEVAFVLVDIRGWRPATAAAAAAAWTVPLRLLARLFLFLLLLFFVLRLVRFGGARLGRWDRERIGGPGAAFLCASVQLVLALEAGELVDRDVDLVGDPGVRAALAHPQPDLIQLGAQGRLASQIGGLGG